MKKNIQDLSIENTIDKSYLKKTINTKDSLNLSKTIKDIYNNLNVKKDTFHILSKKFIFHFNEQNFKKFKTNMTATNGYNAENLDMFI